MKLSLIVAIFCLWFFLPATAAASSVLVFNTTGQPPLNREDGMGFMDRVTEIALNRIGYDLKRIQLPAERGLSNVNKGLDDAEMSRIAGLEKVYPNLRRVPEKIMDWEFVVFSKRDLALSDGWQSLAGEEVAFINGWKILENQVPRSSRVVKVRNEDLLFDLLRNDRTDYVIYEKWAGLKIIHDHGDADIKMLSPPLAVRDMYIYLNKRHENLIPKLSEALRGLKEDGTYQHLEKSILHKLK
ncbi:MAG: transporter substrate-binding domain-containing protein [Gammaproteobacteria bacterium]|nr:transporter substrate-binding domain-containing protein [Gammaproteobacteria bacterium]